MIDLDREVGPLSGLGPSDVELVFGRLHQVVRAVVDLVVKLGVRSVDALVHAELIEVGAVRGIQGSAAVVLGIGIVVGDAFSAAIVVGALDAAGDLLRTAVIASVGVGSSLVGFHEVFFGD